MLSAPQRRIGFLAEACIVFPAPPYRYLRQEWRDRLLHLRHGGLPKGWGGKSPVRMVDASFLETVILSGGVGVNYGSAGQTRWRHFGPICGGAGPLAPQCLMWPHQCGSARRGDYRLSSDYLPRFSPCPSVYVRRGFRRDARTAPLCS